MVFLVEVFIDSPRFCVTASSRVLHGLLQLRYANFASQLAHGIEPRVEFGQPLLGRRIDGRRARAQQQRDDGDDADRDDQAENDEKGFRHGRGSF